ncbi:MAG TPA: tetratricopeptide repeat protein [Pseudonocardiaceae bacterium]|nr:tetratricopeptide repeat protein [Pseudonocardiaceae bacterium]
MTACVKPGCAGTYRSDGTCTDCGFRAPGADRPATGNRATRAEARPSGRTSRRSSAGRSTTGGRTGERLVDVPVMAASDPVSAVLADPRVPFERQKCACGTRVGQPRDGEPGFSEGFCPDCGTPFSFSPKLSSGDVVQGRYQVLGPIAFGGLGWIYLARDTNLGDTAAERWVVLKGLIDTNDADAIESAQNEKRFLVQVDHANIVKIHDFAQQPDPGTGLPVGYIVMEYLGGQSLQDIFMRHLDDDGRRAPLPLRLVLAYGLEILDALAYLHAAGLVYCDLKPDNVLHVVQRIKLIDLGAVIRAGAPPRAVYGTPGFQAPELDHEDGAAIPSVASDLYTVGRTLAVLSFPFAGFTRRYRHELPSPDQEPLFRDEDSFYRLLRRATHPDPTRRFSSADEMREQLYGVLREVLSDTDAKGRPSTLFTAERQTFGTAAGAVPVIDGAVDWATVANALPTPLIDLSDPGAAFLARLGPVEPAELIPTLLAIPERSREVLLRLVDAELTAGRPDAARDYLAHAETTVDWRIDWYRGVIALATNKVTTARAAFESVYDELPGELAPKLALAAAAEWDGDDALALALYERVWHTDTGYVSAAFGLARMLGRAGRWTEAVDVLDDVPAALTQYVPAQVAAIRARLEPGQHRRTSVTDAAVRLERLRMDLERQARVSVEVLTAALALVLDGEAGQASGDHRVLGYALDEYHVRLGLEEAYRELAKVTRDRDRRSALVDHANRVRPKTLV